MIVVVVWLDIIGVDQAWGTSDDLKALEPVAITTVGRLVEENEEYIIVASSWDASGESFGNVNCIPVGVIQKMHTGVEGASGYFGEKI